MGKDIEVASSMYYVIGARGFVGSYIVDELKKRNRKWIGTSWPDEITGYRLLDLTDRVTIDQALNDLAAGDTVIGLAAEANVEMCESEPAETANVNVLGTLRVAQMVRERRARYVWLSSEYVFDGIGGPFNEDDERGPLNEYGRQKLLGEEIIKEIVEDFLIIRTTTVFGYERARKNFLMSFYDRMVRDDVVKIPLDQVSSPTYGPDLARIIVELAGRGDVKGTIHVVGPEVMSRYELARKMAGAMGLSTEKIRPVGTVELGQKARRPLDAGLSIDRLLTMGISPVTVERALEIIRSDYNERIGGVKEISRTSVREAS